MLESILKFAIERSRLIMVAVLAVAALGAWNFTKLPIDAVPDITNVQVVINTKVAGYTPLEVEQRVTYPLETALAGVPNLESTRSISRYGLSQVVAIFSDDTDIYFARQLISERLISAKSELPYSAEPELGPVSTGLGEIFMFTVDALPGATNDDGTLISATDLRTVHDWIIKPQLMQVEGVVEVNPNGGFKREILIAFEPSQLLAHGLSQNDVINAILAHNQNQGAGFIEKSGAQWLVRMSGQLTNLSQLANVAIRSENGQMLKVKDVANVTEGKELRSGAATQDGHEVVLSTVFMLIGENSQKVAKAVGERLTEINKSLPDGIVTNAVYDRTTLVNKTLDTVKTNLVEGAILVIVILFLLLGNVRAALLTAAVIPFAMLMTITGMVQTKVSANLMSLGALDFGLLVDGAIIIVENCLRRLSQASQLAKAQGREAILPLKERLSLVFDATSEVIRPALFGVFIITAVYLPIFALTGVEGKMFHPMAITVVIALVSAMILSITFVPAAIALMFKRPVVEKANPIIDGSERLYKPILTFVLKARWLVVVAALLLVTGATVLGSKLGSEFVPNLDEGDIAMHALRIPGTSLSQSIEMQTLLEAHIANMPEVERVYSKIGTPDVATDPMPPSVADTFIILKPRDLWPDPNKRKSQLVDELEVVVRKVPGNNYEFSQPIQMRFNELLAGVRAELAIKVFGDDFATLASTGENIAAAIANVEGIKDVQVEQTTGLPVLTLTPKSQRLAQYAITLEELQQQVSTAIGGQQAGKFYQGDKRFDIVVRLPEEKRNDTAYLTQLPITLNGGGYVPLQELATIELINGANQVNRENGKRRVVVTANVRDRDLGSFVKDVQQAINSNAEIPAGYWVEYGGTYQKLQSATKRLMVVVPVTLVLIIALLLMALGSFKDSMIIFSGVPLALTGGIFALVLRDIPFSISAAVGFIALSGIAILNGLVMVSFIRELRRNNLAIEHAIIKGAITRLRPVITTAFVASLGFIPMALNTGIGSEVQRPLATVVIGGVISSTILTLFVLPALYRLLHKDTEHKDSNTALADS
ncbi:CusA/CzcA family heavy metal efflux RND transporter [Thalassotalea nanhaiensis]|uniref:CusA/CzcA family heavy metal efflux RND transporter n=1 Tax=Thalassotalea nanhaiensis TaxID=3065648 RepID=A0ABY9TG08_9GAMM|nr:CusA/CzcA family heavy metal efflux RND transporter [Colwelliaceae bacterium SQ345]